jgi:predicted porin
MKKTIVAAAIAAVVAAPAAFAEVSISGKVLAEVTDGKFGTDDSTIKLSGKEDMGNGMHASFVYEGKLSFDNASGGTLTAGGKQKAVMVGNGDVTVAAGFLYGPTKSLYGFSKTAIGEDVASDNSKFLLNGTEASADGVAAMANVGPGKLTVAMVEGATNATLGEHKLMGYTTSLGSVNVGMAYQDFDGADNNTTSVAGNTKLGDVTLGAIYQTRQGGDKAYIVAASTTMGANTIAASYGNTDDTDGAGTDSKGWSAKLTHAMSKQTSAFASFQDTDNTDMETTVGIQHNF